MVIRKQVIRVLRQMFDDTNRRFDGLLRVDADGLAIPPDVRPLTRMIARTFDSYALSPAGHSSAI